MGTIEVEINSRLAPGDLLPNFRYLGQDGKPKSSASLRGEVVLIDFWATWCQPCIAQLPEMKRLHKMLESKKGIRLLGLNLDDNMKTAQAFLSERDLSWEQGFMGTLNDPLKSLGISSFPHYCLVDADGTILEWGNDFEKIKSRVESLLK